MNRLIAMGMAAIVALSACTPYGPCVADRLNVAFDATVTAGGTDQDLALTGQVTPTNLNVPTYERLVAALIEDTVSASGAVWTVDFSLGDEAGYLAIQLAGDPAPQAVLDVSGAFEGGGWGFLAPAPAGVRLSARIGAFTATAASGTLTVLGTRPLRLDADVTVGDRATTFRFRGTIVFDRTIAPTTCD